MSNREFYECCFGDADDGARVGLLGLMAGISEELWCAGWMSGNEYSLWRMVEGGARGYGMGEVEERDVTLLRLLSERCNGWWVYDEEPKFLGMERWRERLSAQAIDTRSAETPSGDRP